MGFRLTDVTIFKLMLLIALLIILGILIDRVVLFSNIMSAVDNAAMR
ncbi:hypothetical protein HYU14_01065 [Candidatus Woesearchaeota archaeon]|nr:hypothetical protein [Candidatus Woesearchaeota archaeon]